MALIASFLYKFTCALKSDSDIRIFEKYQNDEKTEIEMSSVPHEYRYKLQLSTSFTPMQLKQQLLNNCEEEVLAFDENIRIPCQCASMVFFSHIMRENFKMSNFDKK